MQNCVVKEEIDMIGSRDIRKKYILGKAKVAIKLVIFVCVLFLGLNCKTEANAAVTADGKNSTGYYVYCTSFAEIQDALECTSVTYNGSSVKVTVASGNALIVCVRGDYTITSKTEIKGKKYLRANKAAHTLTYGKSMTSWAFEVTGTLIMDTNSDGYVLTLKGNSNASEGKGMIWVNGGTYYLKTGGKISSVTNNGSNAGSAMLLGSGKAYMSGGKITSCKSKNGGAIHMSDGTFEMSGGTVTECNASNNGGGVYVSGGTYTMSDGTVSDCEAAVNGGGVYVSGGTYTISGGTVTGCKANTNGGGIYNNSSITIKSGSNINSCEAQNGGGVYNHTDGNMTMSGGNIGKDGGKNNAYTEGGGVYNCGIFTMTGGNIKYNYSQEEGGGVFSANKTPEKSQKSGKVDDVKFRMTAGNISNNKSEKAGGGIWSGYYSTLNISGGTISDNTAEGSGGGIRCNGGSSLTLQSGGNTSINNATITGNTSNGSYGGGIAVQSIESDNSESYFSCTDSTITYNSVTGKSGDESDEDSGSGYGGGISIKNNTSYPTSVVNFSGNKIYGNEAVRGGGIHTQADMEIDETNTFSSGTVGNFASEYGGHIYVNGSANLTLYGSGYSSILKMNYGKSGNDGGAVFIGKKANVNISSNVWIGHNFAGNEYGNAPNTGAQYLAYGKNNAGGGAIKVNGTLIIAKDTTESSVYKKGASNVRIYDNYAAWGGAIAVNATGKLSMYGSAEADSSSDTQYHEKIWLYDNVSVGNGGAVSITSSSEVDGNIGKGTFWYCYFFRNKCENAGGAIYVASQSLVYNIGYCDFQYNIAGQSGGAIRGSHTITTTGITLLSQINTIRNCNIKYNQAQYGAGCYFSGYVNALVNSNITGNGGTVTLTQKGTYPAYYNSAEYDKTAVTASSGGGITIADTGVIEADLDSSDSYLKKSISGTTISENVASYAGGGIYLLGTLVNDSANTTDSVYIKDNECSGCGAGLYVRSSQQHSNSLKGFVISQNVTKNSSDNAYAGGGIHIVMGNISFQNLQAYKNTTNGYGGGICAVASSDNINCIITSGSIYENAAGRGGGIAVSNNSNTSKVNGSGTVYVYNNSAVAEAGGIYTDGTFSAGNLLLYNNRSGGGLKGSGVDITKNGTFSIASSLTAYGNLGGEAQIYGEKDSSFAADSATFKVGCNNEASEDDIAVKSLGSININNAKGIIRAKQNALYLDPANDNSSFMVSGLNQQAFIMSTYGEDSTSVIYNKLENNSTETSLSKMTIYGEKPISGLEDEGTASLSYGDTYSDYIDVSEYDRLIFTTTKYTYIYGYDNNKNKKGTLFSGSNGEEIDLSGYSYIRFYNVYSTSSGIVTDIEYSLEADTKESKTRCAIINEGLLSTELVWINGNEHIFADTTVSDNNYTVSYATNENAAQIITGIYNTGTISLINNGSISNCKSHAVYTSGPIKFYGGTYYKNGNNNETGSGIYASGKEAVITIESGLFTGNTSYKGTILATEGSNIEIVYALIQENTATEGAGIYIEDSEVLFKDGYIRKNESIRDGGGVYVGGAATGAGMFTQTGGAISSNSAKNNGNGVYINNSNSSRGRYKVAGKATVSSDNDVYECSGTYIEITGVLSGDSFLVTTEKTSTDSGRVIANVETDDTVTYDAQTALYEDKEDAQKERLKESVYKRFKSTDEAYITRSGNLLNDNGKALLFTVSGRKDAGYNKNADIATATSDSPDDAIFLSTTQPVVYEKNCNTEVTDMPNPEKDSMCWYEDYKISENIPQRTDNYYFTGWNTAKDGTGTKYQPGDTITGNDGNHYLYAQWTLKDAQVIVNHYVMDKNGNYPKTPTLSETLQGYVGDKLDAENFLKDSYVIEGVLGHSKNKDVIMTSTNKDMSEAVTAQTAKEFNVISIYYEREKHTVTLNATTGISGVQANNKAWSKQTSVSVYATAYDDPVDKSPFTVSIAAETESHYSWLYWSKSKAAGSSYLENISDTVSVYDSDITLYAIAMEVSQPHIVVNHYVMNTSGQYDDAVETKESDVEYNTVIKPESYKDATYEYVSDDGSFYITEYDHYTVNGKENTGSFAAEDATVYYINLYYKRNKAQINVYGNEWINSITVNGNTIYKNSASCENGNDYQYFSIEAYLESEMSVSADVVNAKAHRVTSFTMWTNVKPSKYKYDSSETVCAANEGSIKADAKNIILTAIGSERAYKYTVKYNANTTETYEGYMDDSTFEYDKTEKLSANEYSIPGYDFIGWNTKSNGTGTLYENKAEIKNLTEDDYGTVVLYAQWSKIENNKLKEPNISASNLFFRVGENIDYEDVFEYVFISDGEGNLIDKETAELTVINISRVMSGKNTAIYPENDAYSFADGISFKKICDYVNTKEEQTYSITVKASNFSEDGKDSIESVKSFTVKIWNVHTYKYYTRAIDAESLTTIPYDSKWATGELYKKLASSLVKNNISDAKYVYRFTYSDLKAIREKSKNDGYKYTKEFSEWFSSKFSPLR
jgi:uncharacterized repeat protein (TIGR02543 family)